MGAGNSTGAGSGPTMSGNNSAPTNPYQPLQQGTNPYAQQPSQQGTNPYAQQPLQQAQAPPASMGGKGNLIRDLQQRGYGQQQQQPPQQQQQQQQYYQQPQQQYYQQQPQYYQQPQQSWQPPQQQFNPYSQPFMSQFAPQRGYGGGRGRGGYPPPYMQQGGQAQQQPGGFLFPPPSPAPTPAPSPSPNMPVNEYKPGYAALRAAGSGGYSPGGGYGESTALLYGHGSTPVPAGIKAPDPGSMTLSVMDEMYNTKTGQRYGTTSGGYSAEPGSGWVSQGQPGYVPL